jgi:hypothetical protein
MKRIRISRPKVRSGHRWHEELSPDPRDPDIVRVKTFPRTAPPRQAPREMTGPAGSRSAALGSIA